MPGTDHGRSTGLPRAMTRMYPTTSRGLGMTPDYADDRPDVLSRFPRNSGSTEALSNFEGAAGVEVS